MKKFIICILFLIPVIIVMAIVASGAIVTLSGTPVNPSDMSVKNNANEVLSSSDILHVDYNGDGEIIIIDVFPTITQNKEVEFEKVASAGAGAVKFTRIDETNKYKVTPDQKGVAQYVVRAKANVNIYKTITLRIAGDTLDDVKIVNASGNELSGMYSLTGKEQLYCEIEPFDALASGRLTWSSSNETVVRVDANGVVYPVSTGTARVQVIAYDKLGNMVTSAVMVDTSEAVAKYEEGYFSSDVTLESVRNYFAVDPDNTTVVNLGGGAFALTRNDTTVKVKAYSCNGDEWGFVDGITEIYTNNGIYFAEFGYLNDAFSEIAGVKISSSDPDVITVLSSTGELKAVKAGTAVITAVYNGVTAEKEIVVRARPYLIELDLGASDAQLGIRMDRVWGLYNLSDTYELTSETVFGLADDTNTYDVRWSVNDEAYATLTPIVGSQNVSIEFNPAACGNGVEVTATLALGERLVPSVSRSFTFKIHENENSVNVYSFEQYENVNARAEQLDIVLQSDIKMVHQTSSVSSLYGNGFMLDGIDCKFDIYYAGTFYCNDSWLKRDAEGNTYLKELIVDDVKIRNFPDMNFDASVWGYGMKFEYIKIPVTIRYMEIEYCRIGCEFYTCNEYTVEGCIFGDNREVGLQIVTGNYGYDETIGAGHPSVLLKNNIFKKTDYPSIMVSNSLTDYDKNLCPYITIEGFMDVYNWKKRSDLSTMIATILSTAGSGFFGDSAGAISTFAAQVLDKLIEADQFDSLCINYAGEEYICPGMMILGAIYYIDPEGRLIDNSDSVEVMELSLRDKNGKTMGQLYGLEIILKNVFKGISTISNSSYLVSMDFSDGESEIMPDDPIPNSKELFARLRGETASDTNEQPEE